MTPPFRMSNLRTPPSPTRAQEDQEVDQLMGQDEVKLNADEIGISDIEEGGLGQPGGHDPTAMTEVSQASTQTSQSVNHSSRTALQALLLVVSKTLGSDGLNLPDPISLSTKWNPMRASE